MAIPKGAHVSADSRNVLGTSDGAADALHPMFAAPAVSTLVREASAAPPSLLGFAPIQRIERIEDPPGLTPQVCFDTAENYGSGRSEELIGRAIASQRDRVLLDGGLTAWRTN